MIKEDIYPTDDDEVLELDNDNVILKSNITVREFLDKIKELGVLIITLDGNIIYDCTGYTIYDETSEYYNITVKDAYIEIINNSHARVDIISTL